MTYGIEVDYTNWDDPDPLLDKNDTEWPKIMHHWSDWGELKYLLIELGVLATEEATIHKVKLINLNTGEDETKTHWSQTRHCIRGPIHKSLYQ